MIESFRVERNRVIELAECQQVPKVMIVAGPNGIGKSTLLYALKTRQNFKGEGRILYIPPHRAWFRQKIRAMYLLSKRLKWADFLAADSTPGVEGLQLRGLPRRFDSLDEAPSTIKHILGQLETRRRDIITRVFDQIGSVSRENIPDVYEPLRKLVSYFLPHLEFSRIDLTSPDDIKCVFKHFYQQAPTGSMEIDIDDLSSGEREVITLFLNFIETQVSASLVKFEGAAIEPQQDLIMLIDSPELHLHPALQRRLLSYVRDITRESRVQFIMTTHSQVLVNEAQSDELYVLVPPERIKGYNQLVKVSTEADKLEAIRSIMGETFSLTLGKPLILVEGRPPALAMKEPSDSRLLDLMCPEFSSYSLIPFHERKRILSLVKELSLSSEITPLGLFVFAILDNDRGIRLGESEIDRVLYWPVCSIENFLLDANSIWEVIQPHREKLGWKDPSDVSSALENIALELKEDEVRLRIEERLGQFKWNSSGSSEEDIKLSLEQGLQKLREFLGDQEKVKKAIEEAKKEVDLIVSNRTMIRWFRGKEILKRFHAKFVGNLGLNYQAFAYQVADRIGKKPRPSELLQIKAHIDAFVPWGLPLALEELIKDLESNKVTLSVPEDMIVRLTENKSDAQKAVEEAKTNAEVQIDRNALKEKSWVNLVALRQHLSGLPSAPLVDRLVRNTDVAMAKTAAIMAAYSL